VFFDNLIGFLGLPLFLPASCKRKADTSGAQRKAGLFEPGNLFSS